MTATPEPTQETSPAQEAETTAAPTQQVTPEPTQEAAVQEQHREAEVNEAETASDTGNSDYVIPDSSTRYLTNTDLTGLSEWQMRIARNEIYARHGGFSSRMIWQIILHPKAGIRQVYQQIS